MKRIGSKSVLVRGCWMAIVALACVLPMRAGASERVFQFRSLEDPSVSVDETRAFCATAPFRYNVLLPARLWVHRTRGSDGRVINETAEAMGIAYACARINNFAFPPYEFPANFYVKFILPSGSYTALGQCTIISNNVPQRGLVLAGCNLRLTEVPAGTIGGSATSSSVFNPFKLVGFNTGSYWTLQLYDTEVDPEDHVDHSLHNHDMPVEEDARSEQQVLDAQAAQAVPVESVTLP